MSHLVYARKYRPQDFKSIVGQEHITRALVNAIVRDKVPHALLFTGPRGVGKTTSARVLAKALNCTGRTLPSGEVVPVSEIISRVEPCGECSNCKEISKGSNFAVIEIDGASNNTVDDVRQLIETLITAPPPNIRYKIYIIDEVHMLSTSAFNALLKTLEEPPPNTVFILATTEPHKIPDTVLSRCQQHDFRKFTLKHLREQLQYICELEGIKVDSNVLELIAKRCQGGMRDASSLLERVVSFCDENITIEESSKILGVFGFSHFAKIIENVFKGNLAELFSLIEEAFSTSLDVKGYFSDFVTSFRTLALYSSSKTNRAQLEVFKRVEELDEDTVSILDNLCELSHSDAFFQSYDLSREIADIALKSQFPRYALEAGIVKLSSLSRLVSLSELVDKLSSNSIIKNSSVTNKVSLNPISELFDIKKKTSPQSEIKIAPPILNEVSQIRSINREVEDENNDANLEVSRFNFIWADFLSFLKKGGHLRLDTYLRRVAPKQVECLTGDSGVFHVLAPKFVFDTLNDPEVSQELKKQLADFTRISSWKITIEVHEQGANKGQVHVPGSLEDNKQERKVNKIKTIEDKAKQDELVKQALSIFSGSVIEKITPTSKA